MEEVLFSVIHFCTKITPVFPNLIKACKMFICTKLLPVSPQSVLALCLFHCRRAYLWRSGQWSSCALRGVTLSPAAVPV